jgi:hypothetical protein
MNFLYITINRNRTSLEYDAYRKLTTTNHIIHKSCHPTGHKMMAMKYLAHRLIIYPISQAAQRAGMATTANALQENECHTHNTNATKCNILRTSQNQINDSEGTKWALFTYSHNKVKTVTEPSNKRI